MGLLVSDAYYKQYSKEVNINWLENINKLKTKVDFSKEDFEYYITAASIASSNIEGNSLDANSFFRNRGKKTTPLKKEVKEVEALIDAYKFASENKLNKANFFKAHSLLSTGILPLKDRGVLRKCGMVVRDLKTSKISYVAVEPEFVKAEFEKLFNDISDLLLKDISFKEIFYYASMLHLWLANIHPFLDGNGRSARLLEKWFLVSKLGAPAWSIYSENYYWTNRPDYYQKIALGFNYYVLHWDRCIPFLKMLPEALRNS